MSPIGAVVTKHRIVSCNIQISNVSKYPEKLDGISNSGIVSSYYIYFLYSSRELDFNIRKVVRACVLPFGLCKNATTRLCSLFQYSSYLKLGKNILPFFIDTGRYLRKQVFVPRGRI